MRSIVYVMSLLWALGWYAATPARAEPRTAPVVVELFTSQSCYSCPPAEALLSELAEDESVIALEWHVDYWDELVYGAAGKWKDPFSSPRHTERQRRYNQALTGVRRAYTPQMVVGGASEAVGSRRTDVRALIHAAEGPRADVVVAPGEGGELTARVSGGPAAEVWVVRFIENATTGVLRGENKGKTLKNAHMVRSLVRLGEHQGGTERFGFAPPVDGEGCAILVQQAGHGPITGAAYCPQS